MYAFAYLAIEVLVFDFQAVKISQIKYEISELNESGTLQIKK